MNNSFIRSVLIVFLFLVIVSSTVAQSHPSSISLISTALIFNAGQTTVTFDQPLLLTSAGQSPEIQLAAVLAKRAGLEYKLSKLATARDLDGIKSLGLVVGASLKGLGAAGIDMNKEKDRVRELLAEAAKRKILILFLHLGGDQRRGELTDALVAEYLPSARMAVILKSADNDGLFSKICQKNHIPLVIVGKTADVADVLRNIFNPQR